jgi:hypothetical protein
VCEETVLSCAESYVRFSQSILAHDEKLSHILNGFRDIHSSVLSVAVSICNLVVQSDYPPEIKVRAVKELFLTIPEDLGASDIHHSELYIRFADAVNRNNSWQDSAYKIPECVAVKKHSSALRSGIVAEPKSAIQNYDCDKISRDQVRDSVIITIGTELWNAGEYTEASKTMAKTLRSIDLPPEISRKEALRYFTCHAGHTEIGHYTHAVKALEILELFDPDRVYSIITDYYKVLGNGFKAISNL